MSPVTTLHRFRIISKLEGISFLLLLFVAMPLKYLFYIPWPVSYVGWAHGVLFIAYMIQGAITASALKWSPAQVLVAVVAAFIPFGPFVLDKNLKRDEKSLVRNQRRR